MPDAVLAIDAGTASVRALVVGSDGQVRARAAAPHSLAYPAPGLVEQNPRAFLETALGTVHHAVNRGGGAGELRAVGVTAQRSSIVVWERATGRALSPIVNWQDLRGADRAQELQAEGFLVLPFSAAAKLELVLDSVPRGRERMRAGELAWGNVDSYLTWHLSEGAAHVTDPSMACATAYYDYEADGWNLALLERQGLTPEFFPTIRDTGGTLAHATEQTLGAEVPIAALIGDQQSAAYGQRCLEPGAGKVTIGTSATCNVNTGGDVVSASATYPLVLWRRDGAITYCIEGMVVTAGAVFDWLVHGLSILDHPADASSVAGMVDDTHGVYVLPTLQGLGTPFGDPSRHMLIGGLTRGATSAHVVRAVIEGVAFRIRQMLDRVYADSKLPRPPALRVDGGVARNDLLLQVLADVVGRPVERMDPLEATAFGAALLAGEAAGVWDGAMADRMRRVNRTFEPRWSDDRRESAFAGWCRACGLTD